MGGGGKNVLARSSALSCAVRAVVPSEDEGGRK